MLQIVHPTHITHFPRQPRHITSASSLSVRQPQPAPQQPHFHIYIRQAADGLFAASGGYKANLALGRAFTFGGHVVTMEVRCTAQEARIAALGQKVQEGVATFGDRELKTYRFIWERMNVVGVDLAQWAKVFGGGTLDASGTVSKRDLGDWLEDKSQNPYLTSLTHYIHKNLQTCRATHIVFNESTTLKITTHPSTPSSLTRIFICHAFEHLPFGPYAGVGGFLSSTSPIEHERLRSIEGIWAVSKALEVYVKKEGGIERVTTLPNHPLVYGDDWDGVRVRKNFGKGVVGVINLGVIKVNNEWC
ncbi:hypothetical protein HDV00_002788 [Rhizophlyctis rosea]|nr:hypothetical protein HDV00_002788 [Rhizophlyctis rosea]